MDELKVIQFTNEYGLKNKWTYKGSRLIKTEFEYPKLTKKTKNTIMSQKQQLFEQIESLFETFKQEHNGSTKKSQANARKAIGEIKKLVTDYRKASVEETK